MGVRPLFDTAKFEANLLASGFNAKQAKGTREALVVVLEESTMDFATKADLNEAVGRIEKSIEGVKVDFQRTIGLQTGVMLFMFLGVVGAAAAWIKLF
jgi:hypothetical protein